MSALLEQIVVSPTQPRSSSRIVAPVVEENSVPNAKLFPIFKPKTNIDKDETPKTKTEEIPNLKSKVGAAKNKKKSKSTEGNNSIIKFLTPLRGKVPTKPNSSDPT